MANCSQCNKRLSFFEAGHSTCPECRAAKERADAESREQLLKAIASRPDPLLAEQARIDAEISEIILTTETVTSMPVSKHLDIITAEAVVGMNIFQDIGSALRDIVGGRNATYQTKLREARQLVLDELRREAHRIGAHAVVAVDLDYSEISGGGKSMLFLVASGTAVRLDKTSESVPS